MTERIVKRHGLEAAIGDWSSADLAVHVCDELGHVNLRGNPQDQAFRRSAEAALGQELPIAANTISEGDLTICWLGPDEWLILTAADAASELVDALNDALAGQHFAVNNLSGGQLAVRLAGKNVRETLAKGCTLDFHPSVFAPGMCAQSGLAKANVLLVRPGDKDEFLVVVRRSFSDYLVAWLKDAARS